MKRLTLDQPSGRRMMVAPPRCTNLCRMWCGKDPYVYRDTLIIQLDP